MVNVEYYKWIGCAVQLLHKSKYHRSLNMCDYVEREILPPLELKQCKLMMKNNGEPFALITWAWLSKSILEEVELTGRSLREDEWNCGEELFFNDWLAPNGSVKEIADYMNKNVFPDQVASSIRRNPDGSVKKVNRWVGVDVHPKKEVICESE